jgi:uncharacterized protein YdeI (YjbR/CyaY-like superfamily)
MKREGSPLKREAEPILAFSRATEWNAWLRSHHATSTGVLLRIPKRGVEDGLSYAEALDVALAWGWIDSQKRALDANAWLQRFTRRTPQSPWSKINRAKAEALMTSRKMEAPGLAEVERAKRDGRWERAYDGARTSSVPPDLAAGLARNARARAFFETMDAANRFAMLYRVHSAKKPETRVERIERFVAMCARHETIHPARTKKQRAATTSKPKKSPRRTK